MTVKSLYSIAEFLRETSLSERTFYRMLKACEITTHRHNGRVFVKGEELQRWINSLPVAQAAA